VWTLQLARTSISLFASVSVTCAVEFISLNLRFPPLVAPSVGRFKQMTVFKFNGFLIGAFVNVSVINENDANVIKEQVHASVIYRFSVNISA
jgi:hypothetical protein